MLKCKQKTKKTVTNTETNTRQVTQEYIKNKCRSKQDKCLCLCIMQEFYNSCQMCTKTHVHNDQKCTTKKQKWKKTRTTNARNKRYNFSQLFYQTFPGKNNAKPPKQAQQGVWRPHTKEQVIAQRWQQIFLSSLESQSDCRNYPERSIRKFNHMW